MAILMMMIKRLSATFAAFVLVACTVGISEGPAAAQGSVPKKDSSKIPAVEASSVFKKVVPDLRQKTKVPLRLPSVLPDMDEEHPIFTNVGSVDGSHYELHLGWTPDCTGENVCSYGSIYGGVTAFRSPQEKDQANGESEPKLIIEPVKLRGGISGEFIDSVCHAYCTQSYIRWKEGRFYYAIGMKGEKETLIKLVNSSIPATVEKRPK